MSELHHHPKPAPEHGHSHGPMRGGERSRLLAVLVLTGVTMVGEFVGGLVTGSLALLGDAFHMLTHFLAIALSYGAIAIALRPAPPDKTYRYWRVEVLAGFVNGLVLLPAAVYVLYESWLRLRDPVPIQAGLTLIVGGVGLAVNVLSALFLHHHARHDLNMRGAFFHMLSDSLSSVGVIVAAVVVHYTGWKAADPLIAAVISLLVLGWCVSLLRSSGRILLESAPAHMDLEEIRGTMKSVAGVEEVHDLHVWTITSRMVALTAHVRLREDARISETEDLRRRLEALLDERHEINHATLQFEVGRAQALDCEHDRAASANP